MGGQGSEGGGDRHPVYPGFRWARARMDPRKVRALRLYRKSLKNVMSWCSDRELYYGQVRSRGSREGGRRSLRPSRLPSARSVPCVSFAPPRTRPRHAEEERVGADRFYAGSHARLSYLRSFSTEARLAGGSRERLVRSTTTRGG